MLFSRPKIVDRLKKATRRNEQGVRSMELLFAFRASNGNRGPNWDWISFTLVRGSLDLDPLQWVLVGVLLFIIPRRYDSLKLLERIILSLRLAAQYFLSLSLLCQKLAYIVKLRLVQSLLNYGNKPVWCSHRGQWVQACLHTLPVQIAPVDDSIRFVSILWNSELLIIARARWPISYCSIRAKQANMLVWSSSFLWIASTRAVTCYPSNLSRFFIKPKPKVAYIN